MKPERNLPQTLWLSGFELLRRYHRYRVIGLETLLEPGAKLIVAYHGRPLAFDQCMLTVVLHERLGYLPHGIIHGAFDENPVMKWLINGLGFVTKDGPELEAAVARGEHILVQPGGTREGCRSFRHRYEVDWGERTGYLRLAIKYGLPIVPVAGDGVDDAFIGLNDGYALGRRLGAPAGLPVWFGVGATGLWPLSLPFPVRMTQLVGQPFHHHLEAGVDVNDREVLRALNREVADAVRELLDRARALGRESG
ncbi:lysophospholipid acyltransferase family protein [Archangium lansingense]|uniref:Lysophospholipid acyltransferase family protein n=1 Tax=Archangium lansingense TaxID=2995310 RepID=A0ABT4ACN5_9BACT|nr:lysophospholipid acyltransferase family protein [Archangium lansinium]MCY1078667.1 lysophospholipid acyltransferase family protein [Archangium lansinium]